MTTPTAFALDRFDLAAARERTITTFTDLRAAARSGAAYLPPAAVDADHNHDRISDRILYTAYRDIQPARPGLCGGAVYADLVVYNGGLLPCGQPVRSIGHWNTPRQIEVFQVLAGTVLMAWTKGDGSAVCYRWCGPGAVTAIPPGAWHITYAPQTGPAVVFNIYTDRLAGPADCGQHDHSSRDAALAPRRLKYTAERPPVALRATGGHQPTLVCDDDAWGPVTSSATNPDWVSHILGGDLVTWHASATPADVTRLRQADPQS